MIPELFQRKQHECLAGLADVEPIAHDNLVGGCGETDAEADRNHDRNPLMMHCKKVNLTLQFIAEIQFHGPRSSSGLKPYPKKVMVIMVMPAPTNARGVQRLIGFANYLAKCIGQHIDKNKRLSMCCVLFTAVYYSFAGQKYTLSLASKAVCSHIFK